MASINSNHVVKTVCSSCYCACGVLAHVENGKVVRLEGDPDHPTSKGRLCVKGVAGLELLYHPDRLNYPLKRVGERGEGKWARISWDEATKTIIDKFNQIKEESGPEAICITTGAGLYSNMGMVGHFAYSLGTPNMLSSAHVCFMPLAAAVRSTIGYPAALLATEIVNDEVLDADCILLWAANPIATVPIPMGHGILDRARSGAKLIVVDPRPTDFAKEADIWLKIRPGTDAALALGMINVIINEKHYDQDFVDNYAFGFEELKQRVQDYPVDKVSEITWIPGEKIVEAARIFAQTRPSCLCQRVPLDQSTNAVQTSRATFILTSICGNLDRKGGNLLNAGSNIIGEYPIMGKLGQLPREVLEKRIGAKELPVFSGPDGIFGFVHPAPWAKAVLEGDPYQVRGMFTTGRNQILGDADSRLMAKALRAMEFSVTMDLFMTPSAELSDIVLPSSCWLEKEGFRGHMGYPYFIPVQHKAIEPLYERREDNEYLIELANRMGLDMPWKDLDEYHDWRLNTPGKKFKDIQGINYIAQPKQYDRHKKGQFKFNTPSGKVELYSTYLEKFGYDPLPSYVAPPETTPEFPLILTAGKKRVEYVHSAGRHIEMFRNRAPVPTMDMSPNTAEQYGIADGDWVWVEAIDFGDRERVKFQARVVEGVLDKVVVAEHGWWIPEEKDQERRWFENNVNVLFSGDEYDPIYGSYNFRNHPCRIYKAREDCPFSLSGK